MKKPYLLTDLAGPFVAGRRVRGDERKDPIMLTDSEAEHELRSGTIVAAPPSDAMPAKKAGKAR